MIRFFCCTKTQKVLEAAFGLTQIFYGESFVLCRASQVSKIFEDFFPLTNSASAEEKSETFDPKCHEKKTSVPQDGHYAVPLAHLPSSLVDNICCDMRKENVSKLQEKTPPRAEKIHLHGYEADCIVFF